MSERRTFSAILGQLSQMLSWIREQLRKNGLDDISSRKVELASEEALVNIIRHAYKETAGMVEINVRKAPKKQIEIEIRDNGPSFNPLKQEIAFNPMASLEEREIGGLGILFIRQYMDEVRYRRESNANILILVKKFTGPSRLK